jgi:hypothetical protein
LPPKRTFNHVPAKTALVLTGSAIALASYMGTSNGTGPDGHAARHSGLAAVLTASHPAQAASINNAGTGGLGTGLANGSRGSGTGGSTGEPGTIALAVYGTARKHPLSRHQGRQHQHRPMHHRMDHAVKHHHARQHRARRHRGRLHGSPWQIAGSLMPAYHWSSWQFHYLNLLWMRESGWNRFACNHSSGAYGIPQAVPGDKMSSAGPNWRTSARTQIIWGMGYIQGRYGNPWNAWQHELSYGWY